MTLDNININELDSMIYVYFGPNYTDFEPGHEIEPKIDAWLSWAGKGNKYALVDDIDLFLSKCVDVEADFAERYKGAFVPKLWDTTALRFLSLVREKVNQALLNSPD
nr:contact-dependent growth inhibition system immunity protein [Pantoea cypripedii]